MNSRKWPRAAINGVPVKVMILDNRCLGMVHQWQKLFPRQALFPDAA